METTTLPQDITIFYVTATAFPEGILAAHEQLHALVPPDGNRRYFAVSRPEHGTIIYRAGAEELQAGEGATFHCDTLVLKKGKYLCVTIENFMQQIPLIGQSFQDMLLHPDIDPEGYCVEWYLDEQDLKCMVRLAD